MAAKWTRDSQEVLDIMGQAYGSTGNSNQDLAARKPTVVTFDKDTLDALQARLKDEKQDIPSV